MRRINVVRYRDGIKVWFTLANDGGLDALTWAMSSTSTGLEGWYVTSHYALPLLGWWHESGPCDALGMPRCWGDSGALIGESVMERFLADGEEGVWQEMQEIADAWAPSAEAAQ